MGSTILKWSVAALLILHLIFTSNSTTNNSPGGPRFPSDLRSVGAASQNLKPGQKPSIVPQTEATRTRQRQERQNNLQQNELLLADDHSRFKGKHLYKNGNFLKDNAARRSFDSIATNRIETKKFLFEHHLKLYNGKTLPITSDDDMLANWFRKPPTKAVPEGEPTTKRVLSVVYGNTDELGKNLKAHGKNSKGDLYITDKSYPVIVFTFNRPENYNKGTWDSVKVEVKMFEARVILGKRDNKLFHLERTERPLKPPTKRYISFNKDELRENANKANKIWNDLAIPETTKPGVLLKEDSPSFLKSKLDVEAELSKDRGIPQKGKEPIRTLGACNKPGGSRKKRSASRCAFYVKPNGDVDSVHPKEFIEEYKRADADGKKKLSEVAKDNLDKIADGGEGDLSSKKKMSQLVQLEEVKKHVGALNVVSQVESGKIAGGQSPAGPSRKPPPSSAFDSLGTKLSKVKTKLSNSKVGKGLAKIANSKIGKGFASGVGQVSDTLGKFFLAKTIVNGIIAGDTTSLAIVGARVGYEVGTGAAVWAGGQFFKAASKLGRATKYLGKVAGPIGAAADIGLSVWSLTKSAGRLRNAANQYERNDAIADIVSDSVDIAVTATVTALSIAFPPAAPLIIAVGAVIDLVSKLVIGIFKAANEVARINAEVPLLGFEKDQVFTSRFFDWFGTREKDYIDHLLEEKGANDLYVQHNLKFLQENPAFLGIVFPSRTLSYEGGCHLTVQHCATNLPILGCTNWETKYTAGTGCDWNRPCSSNNDLCNYYTEPRGSWGYDDFKCVCDKMGNTSFSFPRRNSLVDFREKQQVYWERAVPQDVTNAEFQCKPGNTTYQGYKVSQGNRRTEFLCQNAIGLLQPSNMRWANNKQVMLYDLDDGHDQVYLSPSSPTPTLFRVGNEGRKEFVGGGARNEFVFDGSCTQSLRGSLAGGMSTADAITLLSSCSRGGELKIDFASGTLTDSTGNVDMSFSNIEEISGRKGEGEYVTASCGTRKVVLQGGSSRHPDRIHIPQSDHCAYNLSLVITNYTTVTSRASRGDINLLVDPSWISKSTFVDIHPSGNLRMNIIFLNTSSHQVFLELSSKDQTGIQGTISKLPGKRDQFSFNFVLRERQDVPLLFTETPEGSPYSVLMLSPAEAPVFYHTLPATPSPHTRRSAPDVETMFEVMGHLWSVIGGEGNDEFVLHTIPTFVDGGKGEDRIRLHPNFRTGELVDLSGSNFRSIESLYGAAGVACKVKTACDTKLVVPQGGSKREPDVVTVPASSKCSQRELQIVAKGHTRVVIEGEVGPADADSVTVVALSEKEESSPLRLQLEALSGKSSGLTVLLSVSHKSWTVKGCSRNMTTNLFSLAIDGSQGERVEFKLRASNSTYLSSPYIQLSTKDSEEPPGHLVIEEETATPKVIYHLDQNSSSDRPVSVTGFQGISNLFRIQNPSSSWNIVGGRESDVFSISHVSGVSVDGGGGSGEDTIILELHPQNIGKTIVLNLENKRMFELGSSTQKAGNVSRVHHLIGREGQSDIIHVDCHTKSVAGRGGHGGPQGEDVIFISGKKCGKSSNPPQTSIDLGKHSKVVNSGSPGAFTYYVEDITTSQLELIPTVENTHFVKFGVHPWEVIGDIGFSEEDHVLGLKLKKSGGGASEEARILAFPMLQMEGGSGGEGEYVNPILEFHPPGSFVSSDIRVLGEGVTTSTILIQGPGLLPPEEEVVGLPVDLNRFLINITTKHDGGGGVAGVIRGGAESSNQFWLFSVENELDVLDGGHCSRKGASCTNYLHFGEKFHPEETLEVDFINNLTQLKIGSKVGIETLRNFQQVVGRPGNGSFDKILVSCEIKQVSEFESVVIPVKGKEGEEGELEECNYNLIIGIGKETRVQFQSRENSSSSGWNNTFHYRFTVPRSFELDREDDFDLIGPTHNFYLPFKVDDLEELGFDPESERLRYKISGEEYSIEMIEYVATEQFYLQPVMTTQDGFLIQVAIDGTILLSLGAGSSFPSLSNIKSEVVPAFGNVAAKLGVTILVQTDKELLYVGHGKVEGDRNVLQNVGYSVSHLVGGGADDTIYEIVSLEKDVYIYPGYLQLMGEDDDEAKVNRSKQTIDLTDVVVPIRVESGAKYVPKVEQVGDDIIVSMTGWESLHPGRIFIVDGAVYEGGDSGGIQVLLNAAIFDFVELGSSSGSGASQRHIRSGSNEQPLLTEANSTGWRLSPRPIEIPEGMVYSLSAEDLEDGHVIQLETNNNNTENRNGSRRNVPNFKVVRNGTDLYMTDVMGAGSGSASDDIIEITTIVISDFFKVKPMESTENNTAQRHNHTEGAEEDIWEHNNLPGGLLAVSISLPGLSLLLNESQILNTSQSGEWKEVPRGQILQWELALHEVEDNILEDYPDIERAFRPEEILRGSGDDIRVEFLMLLFLGTAGGLVIIILIAIGIAFVIYRRHVIGEYHVNPNESIQMETKKNAKGKEKIVVYDALSTTN